MSTPIIRSTSQTIVVDGAGRNDLQIGSLVTCTDINPANTGHSYLWSFVDIPIGSSIGITDATASTCSFTPDVVGSYFIMCQVDGAVFSREILSVPLPRSGARIPAFNEGGPDYTGEGNLKGWHTALTEFMRALDAGAGLVLSAPQTISITDANGGPVIFDASSVSFSDTEAIQVIGPGSLEVFGVLKSGGIVVAQGTNILIGIPGNPATAGDETQYGVAIGPGASIGLPSVSCTGPVAVGYNVAAQGTDSVAVGANSSAPPNSIVIGTGIDGIESVCLISTNTGLAAFSVEGVFYITSVDLNTASTGLILTYRQNSGDYNTDVVSIGADDSGGTGYALLRVPNSGGCMG